jgi:hypothetical protein
VTCIYCQVGYGVCLSDTRCRSHFKNPTNFKILKEPLLVQKQTLHQQKALNLSYLEPEGQGWGILMRVWQCHRKQRVKNPPRACKKSSKNAFCAKWAWHPHDTAMLLCSQLLIAETRAFCWCNVCFCTSNDLFKILKKKLEKIYFYNFRHFEKLRK